MTFESICTPLLLCLVISTSFMAEHPSKLSDNLTSYISSPWCKDALYKNLKGFTYIRIQNVFRRTEFAGKVYYLWLGVLCLFFATQYNMDYICILASRDWISSLKTGWCWDRKHYLKEELLRLLQIYIFLWFVVPFLLNVCIQLSVIELHWCLLTSN